MEIRPVGTEQPITTPVEQPLSPSERAERLDLVKAVTAVNESGALGSQSELTFSFDRKSRRPILRIVDRQTREVIRQIPSEELLQLANSGD